MVFHNEPQHRNPQEPDTMLSPRPASRVPRVSAQTPHRERMVVLCGGNHRRNFGRDNLANRRVESAGDAWDILPGCWAL